MNEFQEFAAGLGKIVGAVITGVAYCENWNGSPVVIINLSQDGGKLLTSHYIPYSIKSQKRNKNESSKLY